MSFFAFPLEEDKINKRIKEKVVFHLISMPLSKYSTKELQSTHLAPDIIKKASFEIFGSNFGEIREKMIKEHEQDFFNDFTIEIDKEKREKLVKRIKIFLEKIKDRDKENVFVFLGGNHLISYFTIKALKPDVVIQFDAHADVDPLEKELKHSNFVRFLLEEKKIKIIQIGLSNTSLEEYEFLHEYSNQIKFFKSVDFHIKRENIKKEIFKSIEKIYKTNQKKVSIYITIDVDVFEGNFASYQGEILGIKVMDFLLFIKEIIENVKKSKKGKIIGFDLVEFNPHLDLNNYWANSIARILIEIISML